MNWRQWFKNEKIPRPLATHEYGAAEEERYQAYRARMMEELGISAQWRRGGSQMFGFEECANDDRTGFEEE